MKTVIPFILPFLIFSCSTSTTENYGLNSDSLKVVLNKTISIAFQDSEQVILYSDSLDSSIYTKGALRKILQNNPELNESIECSPDITYSKRAFILAKNYENVDYFGSEAGQDKYYVLYAYFLKQRNGENRYQIQRQRLNDIYQLINSIFGKLAYGGTYFGHQTFRITAYVEYSIYSQIGNDNYFAKKYDYSIQKQLYISAFRQLIKDEISEDNGTSGKEKMEREKELLNSVDRINDLIANYADLKCAQEFQYSKY